jgi:hypothetical protein
MPCPRCLAPRGPNHRSATLVHREAEQARQETEEHARREAAARAKAEARLAAVERSTAPCLT